jgi:HlyD family secretion protein
MAHSGKSGRLILIVLVVLIAGGIGAYLWHKRREPAPTYNTTTASRGSIIQKITASGDLQPVVQVEVSSQVSGIIQEVMVDFNSRVKTGDVIAQIDPATYDSRLKQAQAQLANTRANYALVKVNHDRTLSLFERNLVSQQELDQVRAQLQQAEAQLLIQQAAVEDAETNLSRCTITAPIDGIIISRVAERGMTVAASLNAPTLFVIANDLSKMQIVAAVAEADIGNVEVGQAVTFQVDAFPERQFRGRVAQIRNSPVVVQNVVSYNTLIDVSNEELRLRPGMTATVSIILARRDDVLRIANSALRARIPENLLPPPPAPAAEKAGGAPAPAALATATREQMFAIMQEAGLTPGGGRPSPEVIAKAREIAASRGLAWPERGPGGEGRGGGGSASAMSNQPVTRTLYRLVNGSETPRLEAVSVRLGVSDGSFTEVLDGITENDRVVTGVILTAGNPSPAPTANPFGAGGRRF